MLVVAVLQIQESCRPCPTRHATWRHLTAQSIYLEPLSAFRYFYCSYVLVYSESAGLRRILPAFRIRRVAENNRADGRDRKRFRFFDKSMWRRLNLDIYDGLFSKLFSERNENRGLHGGIDANIVVVEQVGSRNCFQMLELSWFKQISSTAAFIRGPLGAEASLDPSFSL